MYKPWVPGTPWQMGAYPSEAYSDSGEVQANTRMQLDGFYQTGRRFSLGGWSADEWARFFEGAGRSVSQVYGTIAQRPVAAPAVPIQMTPIGGVPTWAIVGLLAVGGIWLLGRKGR